MAADDEVLETSTGSGKEHYLEILVTDIVTDHVEKFGVKAQLVYLVGRAASKEVKYKSLNVTKQVEMKQAMGKEWSKWVQFSATKKLSKNDLQKLMTAHVHIRPVNTRWVLTLKDDEACKARLVVVGCQEPRGQIRSDSPTGSQLAFHITLWFATQKGWSLRCLDAATAFLQSKGIVDRTLVEDARGQPASRHGTRRDCFGDWLDLRHLRCWPHVVHLLEGDLRQQQVPRVTT